MSNSPNSVDAHPTDSSKSNLGLILQRSGEELILEKATDRFTLRLLSRIPTDEQQFPQTWGNWQRTIPQAQLELFLVESSQLEIAMAQVRADPNVAFASHAYRLKNHYGSYIYLTDQITIQFADWVDAARVNTISTLNRLVQVQPVLGVPNAFVFLVSKQATENPLKITHKLQQLPEILVAEPNILIQHQTHYKPHDPMYPQQWYLNHQGGDLLTLGSHISVEPAWDMTRGVRSIVIAIADNSFDLTHPDFQGVGKVVAPRDFQENNFPPISQQQATSHGTACAGLAIAEENSIGIVGVAPGCAFMPIGMTGFLDDQGIEEIFHWAVDKGASVISCSWGADSVYFTLSLRQRAAITYAATAGRDGKGCVITFAAGNANRPINGVVNEKKWPKDTLNGQTTWLNGFAIHPDVIPVAASTSLNTKAAYSNWGANISVCAPSNNAIPGIWLEDKGFTYTQPIISQPLAGRGILTTDQVGVAGYDSGNYTTNFGGTSSATPIVAGVAALVLSINSHLIAQQVKGILQDTADKIVDPKPDAQLGLSLGNYDHHGHSQWFGYGKVNAAKAVYAAQQLLTSSSQPLTKLHFQNKTQLAIPDNQLSGVTSEIAIAQNATIRDIEVSVNITHDFLGDIEIYLIAPNSKRILLQSRTLGRQTILQTTYTIKSHPVLDQLLAVPANGSWKLQIIDYSPQDIGQLHSWELVIGY